MGTLKAKAQSILTEKNTKIIPSNIISSVKIFDVIGEASGDAETLPVQVPEKFDLDLRGRLGTKMFRLNISKLLNMIDGEIPICINVVGFGKDAGESEWYSNNNINVYGTSTWERIDNDVLGSTDIIVSETDEDKIYRFEIETPGYSFIETGLQTQLDVNSSDRNKFLGVYRYSE